MRQMKVVAGIVAVFLLGAFAGMFAAHRYYRHHGPSFAWEGTKAAERAIVDRLSRELSMDSRQKEQLREIVREAQAEIAPIRRKMRPEIEAVLSHADEEVRKILRPDQRTKFDEIVAKRKARMGNRDRRKGPPSPAR